MARIKIKLQFRGVAKGTHLLFVHSQTQKQGWVPVTAVSESAELMAKAPTKFNQTIEVEIDEDVAKEQEWLETT